MKSKELDAIRFMRNAVGAVFLSGLSAAEAGAAERAVGAAITLSPATALIVLAAVLFFFGFRWQKE